MSGDTPEIRYCPIVPGRASIISPARGRRPKILRASEVQTAKGTCPFCPGNEFMTPPATLTLRRVEGKLVYDWEQGTERFTDWVVRIIPNKYPALTHEGGGERHAYGYHEVIVENPNHDAQPPVAPLDELTLTFEATFKRVREILATDARIKYAIVIRNYGARGGASIPHPHTQLFASEAPMPLIDEELRAFEEAKLKGRECPLCAEIRKAREDGRVVFEEGNYVAFTAWAPRQPYEVWLAPRKHVDSPLNMGRNELREFAAAFKKLTAVVRDRLGDPAYNLWIHMPPRHALGSGVFHWHVELAPVIATWGGLEKGGRVFIVTVHPEDAAKELRGEA